MVAKLRNLNQVVLEPGAYVNALMDHIIMLGTTMITVNHCDVLVGLRLIVIAKRTVDGTTME